MAVRRSSCQGKAMTAKDEKAERLAAALRENLKRRKAQARAANATEPPMEDEMALDHGFTEDWFSHVVPVWGELLFTFKPSRILEIGSYEGRSTCFLIENLAAERPIELHCIDTWAGGIEHEPGAMAAVERRFDNNVRQIGASAPHAVTVRKHKGMSSDVLARMLARGRREHFDLIYVDGSHQAPDVLLDALLWFQLLKVGGLLIFDDYNWSLSEPGEEDFYLMPKPAIDAFVNIFQRKLSVLQYPLYQLYVKKTAA